MNSSRHQPSRRANLRWQLILPVWACLAILTLAYSAATVQLAEQGRDEASRQSVTAHAAQLTTEWIAKPDAAQVQELQARLARVLANSELLGIAVYQPVEGLDRMQRIAVQSVGNPARPHLPSTIDGPSRWTDPTQPSTHCTGDLQVATAVAVADGNVQAAVRVITPLGHTHESIMAYRAWGLIASLVFVTASFYVGDRVARRFGGQLERVIARVEALRDGNLGVNIPPTADRELDRLSSGLCDLVRGLLETQQQLEDSLRQAEEQQDEARVVEISQLHGRLEERSKMLEQAYVEMQTLDKAKDAFLSNLSHEMRTPLTSIIAAKEILTDFADDDPESRPEFLRIIHTESQRLLVLIDELLDLAKIEAKALQLHFGRFDICTLAERTAAEIFERGHDRKVALSISKPPEPVYCECDAERIGRILRSLIDDAFRHSPDPGTVRLRIRHDDVLVRIGIEDEEAYGTGRTNNTHGQPSGGSMLGAAIADKLANAHGGTLSRRQADSGGTLVELSLPIHSTVTTGPRTA